MIGVPEVLWFCIFGSLVCGGSLIAQKHGHSTLAGAGWGVLAWLAAMSCYVIWRLLHDWTQRHKHPNRQDVPMWFDVCVWACFIVTASFTILIGRQIFS